MSFAIGDRVVMTNVARVTAGAVGRVIGVQSTITPSYVVEPEDRLFDTGVYPETDLRVYTLRVRPAQLPTSMRNSASRWRDRP